MNELFLLNKNPIWAALNNQSGRMRPAGQQFDMPALGQWSQARGPRTRRKIKISRTIKSFWHNFFNILTINSILKIFFSMRPAKPLFESHATPESHWVWDPRDSTLPLKANFINILQVDFVPILFSQKILKPNSN